MDVDLCLVFDVDERWSVEQFNQTLDFLANLTDLFTIGPDATRVAVVGPDPILTAFTLNSHTDAESVIDAIKSIPLTYVQNKTKVYPDFRRQCFRTATGARHGFKNLAVLLLPSSTGGTKHLQFVQDSTDVDVAVVAVGTLDPRAHSASNSPQFTDALRKTSSATENFAFETVSHVDLNRPSTLENIKEKMCASVQGEF